MADDKDNGKDKDGAIENPENRKLTDVGLRQRDDRATRSEEGIERPQGEFGGGLARRYEATDIALRPILLTAAVVIGMTLASYLVLWGMYHFWGGREEDKGKMTLPIQEGTNQLPPEPRLQPMVDLERKDYTGDYLLHGTETGDMLVYREQQKKTMEAMNVEAAMNQIAANGLPAGPDWEMQPGTVMVQGVVMTAADAAAQQQFLRNYAQRQGMESGAPALPQQQTQTTLPSAGTGAAQPQGTAAGQGQSPRGNAPRPTAGQRPGGQ
jgi:hypothetical protein